MEIALKNLFTLPVYTYDHAKPDGKVDRETRTYEVNINGKEYLTQGFITVETEHNLVVCTQVVSECYPYTKILKPFKVLQSSSYENSEEEAKGWAERLQRDYADETGVIFPIYVRS